MELAHCQWRMTQRPDDENKRIFLFNYVEENSFNIQVINLPLALLFCDVISSPPSVQRASTQANAPRREKMKKKWESKVKRVNVKVFLFVFLWKIVDGTRWLRGSSRFGRSNYLTDDCEMSWNGMDGESWGDSPFLWFHSSNASTGFNIAAESWVNTQRKRTITSYDNWSRAMWWGRTMNEEKEFNKQTQKHGN